MPVRSPTQHEPFNLLIFYSTLCVFCIKGFPIWDHHVIVFWGIQPTHSITLLRKVNEYICYAAYSISVHTPLLCFIVLCFFHYGYIIISCTLSRMWLLILLGAKLNNVSKGGPMWCLKHWVISDLNGILSDFEANVCDWGNACQTAPMWMSLDFTYDKPAPVQTMAWCHQATIHHPS